MLIVFMMGLIFALNCLAFVLFVTVILFMTLICPYLPIQIQEYKLRSMALGMRPSFVLILIDTKATELLHDYTSPLSLSSSLLHVSVALPF
jgi:hypothetical protein